MSTQAYHRPASVQEALALRAADGEARFLAGGTDLLVGTGPAPRTLVSLRAIPELHGIDAGGIGALTTIGEITRHAGLAADHPVLVAAARRLGSVQIRNQATIGGNLCRAAPCADTAPPLLVLEARARIQGPRGTRVVDLASFFRGPGVTCLAPEEMLTRIELDPPRPGSVGAFLKKGRVRMDLSIASVAVLLEAEGRRITRIRLAAGSVAPVPLRLREVEALLAGRVVDEALLLAAGRLAAESVLPIDDVRSTAAYRRHIVGVYVRRGITQALAGESA